MTVDDFSDVPPGAEGLSAPAPGGWHVAFLQHRNLNPSHTIGGSRDLSINIEQGKKITATFVPECGSCRFELRQGAGGYLFLSYPGKSIREVPFLDKDLQVRRYDRILIDFQDAPTEGTVRLTFLSTFGRGTQTQSFRGPGKHSFYFSDFPEVDFHSVQSIRWEFICGSSPAVRTIEIDRIYVTDDEPWQYVLWVLESVAFALAVIFTTWFCVSCPLRKRQSGDQAG